MTCSLMFEQGVWCCLELLPCSHLAVTSSWHGTIKLNGCGWCTCLSLVIRLQALCRQKEFLPYETQYLQHLLATYFLNELVDKWVAYKIASLPFYSFQIYLKSSLHMFFHDVSTLFYYSKLLRAHSWIIDLDLWFYLCYTFNLNRKIKFHKPIYYWLWKKGGREHKLACRTIILLANQEKKLKR